MNESGVITRREFLITAGLLTGSLAVVSLPFVSGCGYPVSPMISEDAYLVDRKRIIVDITQAPQLLQQGDSATITNEASHINLIIARISKDRFVAALNECPHREKAIGYNQREVCFVCASGKSKFRLDGSIITSPVDTPLHIFHSRLDGNMLFIDTEKESV